MDEKDFMSDIIKEMSDSELEAYCEVIMQDMETSGGKENDDE